MKTCLRLLAVCCAFYLLASTALATELVTNGGFETHDLTGWTTTGDTAHIFVCGDGATFFCNELGGFVPDGAPHSGVNAAAFGPIPFGTLEQTLATTSGQSYNLTFWVENCVDDTSCTPNSLSVTWGGTTVYSQTDLPPFFWTEVTVSNLLATSGSTLLSFGGENVPSFFLLDDISVVPSTTTPEPSTLLLLGSGLVSMTGLVARKLRR